MEIKTSRVLVRALMLSDQSLPSWFNYLLTAPSPNTTIYGMINVNTNLRTWIFQYSIHHSVANEWVGSRHESSRNLRRIRGHEPIFTNQVSKVLIFWPLLPPPPRPLSSPTGWWRIWDCPTAILDDPDMIRYVQEILKRPALPLSEKSITCYF